MSSIYIATPDITDKMISQFYDRNDSRISSWDGRVDAEVNRVAISLGVDIADIDTSPLNDKVKEYALAYLGMMVCFDNRYGNNNDQIIDKYKNGYEDYLAAISRIASQLTAEMFTEAESSLDAEDAIGQGVLWRA